MREVIVIKTHNVFFDRSTPEGHSVLSADLGRSLVEADKSGDVSKSEIALGKIHHEIVTNMRDVPKATEDEKFNIDKMDTYVLSEMNMKKEFQGLILNSIMKDGNTFRMTYESMKNENFPPSWVVDMEVANVFRLILSETGNYGSVDKDANSP